MQRFYVKDMVCQHCVERIQKAMGEEKIAGEISLQDHWVQAEQGDVLRELLLDLGFTPEEV